MKPKRLADTAVPLVAGYALVYLSSTLTVWSGGFAFLPAFVETASSDLAGVPAARLIAFPLAYLAGGLLAARPRLLRLPRVALPAVAGVLLTAGMCVVAIFPDWEAAAYAASFAIGAGMAFLFMAWELVLSSRGEVQVVGMIGWAAVVSSALYIVFSSLDELNVATTVVAFAVVLACSVLTATLVRRLDRGGELPPSDPCTAGAARALVSELWRPTLCVAAYGFVHEAVRASCFTEPALMQTVNVLSSTGILVSGIALVVLRAVRRSSIADADDMGLGNVYRMGFPLAVTGFALMPFLGEGYRYAFVAFAFTAFSVLISLFMARCIRVARTHGVSAVCVFGVGSSAVYLFASLGSFFGGWSDAFNRFGVSQVFLIAFFSIYLLGLVTFVIRPRGSQGKGESRAVAGAGVTGFSGAAGAEAPGVMATSGEPVVTEDLREARCRLLAERYELTPRERDVFFLYAAGRDTPAICARLSITENTVRTHLRGIYRKMGIHGKQELFDLVEGE